MKSNFFVKTYLQQHTENNVWKKKVWELLKYFEFTLEEIDELSINIYTIEIIYQRNPGTILNYLCGLHSIVISNEDFQSLLEVLSEIKISTEDEEMFVEIFIAILNSNEYEKDSYLTAQLMKYISKHSQSDKYFSIIYKYLEDEYLDSVIKISILDCIISKNLGPLLNFDGNVVFIRLKNYVQNSDSEVIVKILTILDASLDHPLDLDSFDSILKDISKIQCSLVTFQLNLLLEKIKNFNIVDISEYKVKIELLHNEKCNSFEEFADCAHCLSNQVLDCY